MSNLSPFTWSSPFRLLRGFRKREQSRVLLETAYHLVASFDTAYDKAAVSVGGISDKDICLQLLEFFIQVIQLFKKHLVTCLFLLFHLLRWWALIGLYGYALPWIRIHDGPGMKFYAMLNSLVDPTPKQAYMRCLLPALPKNEASTTTANLFCFERLIIFFANSMFIFPQSYSHSNLFR